MTKHATKQENWLEVAANLAERHPLETLTIEGSFLQLSLIDFLRSGARTQRAILDMQADFLTIIPRFHNALVQAGHGDGQACLNCTSQSAMQLYNEILRDARTLVERQNAGGLN